MNIDTRSRPEGTPADRDGPEEALRAVSASDGISSAGPGGQAGIVQPPPVEPLEAATEIVGRQRPPLREDPPSGPGDAGAGWEEPLGTGADPDGEESRPKRKQLADIERALSGERANLLRQVQQASRGDATAGSAEQGDVCDLSAQDIERNISLSLRERDRMKLHAIEGALERIRDGTYGICEECEATIPLDRLRIMPFATTCVSCQSKHEKMEKLSRQAGGGPAGSSLYSTEFVGSEE